MLVQIELTNTTMIGNIINELGQNVYVNVNNETFKFHKDQVIELDAQQAAEMNMIDALNGENISFEIEGNGDEGALFIIESDKYVILADVDAAAGVYTMETRHIDNSTKHSFDANYEKYRNKKSYAKLETLIRNVIKFANK